MADKKAKNGKQGEGGGRPTVMTPEVVQKLEQAFCSDMTDLEACLYAGISKATLHTYQNANPKFKDRKELLKNTLSLKAKTRVAKEINAGDLETAQWWLERRRKKEFNKKINLDHTSGDEPMAPVFLAKERDL